MAYELLAGQPPFQGSTPARLLAAHMSETPRDLRAFRADIPPALADLVMACLAKDPDGRPQQARRPGARAGDGHVERQTPPPRRRSLRGGRIPVGKAIGLWAAATAGVGRHGMGGDRRDRAARLGAARARSASCSPDCRSSASPPSCSGGASGVHDDTAAHAGRRRPRSGHAGHAGAQGEPACLVAPDLDGRWDRGRRVRAARRRLHGHAGVRHRAGRVAPGQGRLRRQGRPSSSPTSALRPATPLSAPPSPRRCAPTWRSRARSTSSPAPRCATSWA